MTGEEWEQIKIADRLAARQQWHADPEIAHTFHATWGAGEGAAIDWEGSGPYAGKDEPRWVPGVDPRPVALDLMPTVTPGTHASQEGCRPEHFAPEIELLEEEPGGWSVVGDMAVIVWAERYLSEAECRAIVGADLPLFGRHLSLRGHRVHALTIRGWWGETGEWQEGRCEDMGCRFWSLASYSHGDPRRRLIKVSDQTPGLAPGEGLALRVNHRETCMHVLDPVSCLRAESERLRHRPAAGVADGRHGACHLGLLLATLPRYLAEIAARVPAKVNTREEEARAGIAQAAAQELLCGDDARNQAPS